MSHAEQRAWFLSVKDRIPEAFIDVDVLDVGSMDINGNARVFFTGSRYVGIDVGPGPNVDLVMPGQDADFPDGAFDVVLSAECFEHNAHWRETFLNMHRMSNDLVIVSCATTGRAEHGTARTTPMVSPHTTDYYQNLTPQDFVDSFDLDSLFTVWQFEIDEEAHDLYFLGIK